MKNISDVDKNFKVETSLNEKDIVFYDVRNKPFDIYGLYDKENYAEFKRIPTDVAQRTNEGVLALHMNTAGGRVRFCTDSPYIAISAETSSYYHSPHMDAIAKMGYDIYTITDGKYTYVETFKPPVDGSLSFESITYPKGEGMREYIINFPLYGPVTHLYVGIKEGSAITSGGCYVNSKPVVYYGSSITQGGCASRPGTCYQAFISRKYNCDYINLGFSGSAHGEDAITDYIAGLDMSCFVMDYDHNAAYIAELEEKHEAMFRKIRQANPALPIIIVSAPTDCFIESVAERRTTIRRTYDNAINSGDKNVYFVDGMAMFGELAKDCTVDGCHPTDLGFYLMAETISKAMDEANIF